MKTRRIKDPRWGELITLVWNCSQEELGEYILKKTGCQIVQSRQSDGSFFSIHGVKFDEQFLWIEEFTWTINQQALLAHEIFHLVDCVLGDRGFELNPGSREAYAYYLQDLIRAVWLALNPEPARKKKVKKKKVKKKKK